MHGNTSEECLRKIIDFVDTFSELSEVSDKGIKEYYSHCHFSVNAMKELTHWIGQTGRRKGSL